MPLDEIYSVSEITHSIKLLLEENIAPLWIEGEVSNFKAHYSGHYYFTLKDSGAQISAVMWRSRASQMHFRLEDGMKVQAFGSIRLYEKSGRYQIDIMRMQPAGVGKLQLAFEQLKQKLKDEGLFDAEHKKPLPPFPSRIGIVTSSTGAAIRDILNVLKRRAPHLEIIVKPAKVQGEGAAEEIAAAVELFNRWGEVDVLIVGRGGGSLEDLWAFNEEITARAVYNSKIPVISAVGHEIDFSITDFTADLRAATPSAAAELAVPDYTEIRGQVLYLKERLSRNLENYIRQLKTAVASLANSYGLRRIEDRIRQLALQVDDLDTKLAQAGFFQLNQRKNVVTQLEKRLDGLNPKQVLKRGYSITYKNGVVLKDADALRMMDVLETEVAHGRFSSSVIKINKDTENA